MAAPTATIFVGVHGLDSGLSGDPLHQFEPADGDAGEPPTNHHFKSSSLVEKLGVLEGLPPPGTRQRSITLLEASFLELGPAVQGEIEMLWGPSGVPDGTAD